MEGPGRHRGIVKSEEEITLSYEARHKRALARGEVNDRLGEAQRTFEAAELALGTIAAEQIAQVTSKNDRDAWQARLEAEREAAHDEQERLLGLL